MLNPITAAASDNPYSYYAELVRTKPFYYDDGLALWVASNAEIAREILTSDFCRVRPADEPVPKAILDSTAGMIFRHLVRMTDGATHCPLKKAVAESVCAIDTNLLIRTGEKYAQVLFDELYSAETFGWISDYAFRLPIYTMANLLGISEADFPETEKLMSDFVRCIAPGGTAEQIEKAKAAAERLFEIFEQTFSQTGENILSRLAQNLDKFGGPNYNAAIANGVGLLFQTYEATAGLIGNSLAALAAHPSIAAQVKANLALAVNVVAEVSRYDSPIQNTRRFVSADGKIAGENIKSGDVILIVIAAANRDSKINPAPETFDIFRENRQSLTFGAGAHACPGEIIASTIAETGVRKLILSNIEISKIENNRYRASGNTRIPLF